MAASLKSKELVSPWPRFVSRLSDLYQPCRFYILSNRKKKRRIINPTTSYKSTLPTTDSQCAENFPSLVSGCQVVPTVVMRQLVPPGCNLLVFFIRSNLSPRFRSALLTIVSWMCFYFFKDDMNGEHNLHDETPSSHLYPPPCHPRSSPLQLNKFSSFLSAGSLRSGDWLVHIVLEERRAGGAQWG